MAGTTRLGPGEHGTRQNFLDTLSSLLLGGTRELERRRLKKFCSNSSTEAAAEVVLRQRRALSPVSSVEVPWRVGPREREEFY